MGWLSRLFGGGASIPQLPGKTYTVGIVGESYRNRDGTSRQAEIKRCGEGDFVDLVPEHDNPYDPFAIAVFSDRGCGIGYISRDHNQWIGEKLGQGQIASARIQAIIGGGSGKPTRGVLLSIRIL